MGNTPSGGNEADVSHFDHSFAARLLGSSEGLVTAPESPVSIAACLDDDILGKGGRAITVEIKGGDLLLIEAGGISKDKVLVKVAYAAIRILTWDHGLSSVKVTFAGGKDVGKYSSNLSSSPDAYVILRLAVSVELEAEMRARIRSELRRTFGATDNSMVTPEAAAAAGVAVPAFHYIGLFAGGTKPKPFQRRRANLSDKVPDGALPPLGAMRAAAVTANNGLAKPLRPGTGQRNAQALDYVFNGVNEIPFLWSYDCGSAGAAVGSTSTSGGTLIFSHEGIALCGSNGCAGPVKPYSDISAWEFLEAEQAGGATAALQMTMGGVTRQYGLSPLCLTPARCALEYFYNTDPAVVAAGATAGATIKWPMPGSVAGRDIASVLTLAGTVPAPACPPRKRDVVDLDGTILRAGHTVKSVGKPSQRVKGAPTGIMALGSGDKKQKLETNTTVGRHWDKAVLHQGWLQKRRGGAAAVKTAQWRYFILYATPQGPYLAYYADVTDLPLFSTARGERGLVDMCTVQYFRPTSSDPTAPAHAFDIVTTDRDWALGAETPAALQAWLAALGRATEQAVAIVSDEEVIFECHCRHMTSTNKLSPDVRASLSLGSMGATLRETGEEGIDNGMKTTRSTFWPYTDFFKWFLVTAPDGRKGISLQCFTDSKFKVKQEVLLCFTSGSSAARCASVIEYGVEKFMSAMHMTLECAPRGPVSPRQSQPGARGPTATAAATGAAAAAAAAASSGGGGSASGHSTPPRPARHSMSMDEDNWLDVINSPPKPETAQVSSGGLLLYDSDKEDAPASSSSRPASSVTTGWDPNDAASLGAFSSFGSDSKHTAAAAAADQSAWDTSSSEAHTSSLFAGAANSSSAAADGWSVTDAPSFAPTFAPTPAFSAAPAAAAAASTASAGFDAWSVPALPAAALPGSPPTNSDGFSSGAGFSNGAFCPTPPQALSPGSAAWFTGSPGATAASANGATSGAADPFNPMAFNDMFGGAKAPAPLQHPASVWD